MLDDNIPIIEESVTNSGETKFNSNLPIMLNAFKQAGRSIARVLNQKGVKQTRSVIPLAGAAFTYRITNTSRL
jgi:hypothetical protein